MSHCLRMAMLGMAMLACLVFGSIPAFATTTAAAPPNCSVAHSAFDAKSAGMPSGGIFDFDIYAPHGEENCGAGNFPVVFFVTGVGGNVPTSMYSDLLKRLVRRGFIVVGVHRLERPSYKFEGKKFLEVLEWAKNGHLQALMSQFNFLAVPDVSHRTAVMGQSAGNHVIGEALELDCSIAKAFVMIDPVDGTDPYGLDRKQDLIRPGTQLPFVMPGLLLDNGLDPKRLNPLFPACAPANLSNGRFYDAWPGPIWNINATAYGHIDCLDDVGMASWVCPTDPKTDKAAYRAMLADASATFLSSLFDGKPGLLKLLEDPSQYSVDVIMKHDLKGLNYNQVQAGCINTRPRTSTISSEFFT